MTSIAKACIATNVRNFSPGVPTLPNTTKNTGKVFINLLFERVDLKMASLIGHGDTETKCLVVPVRGGFLFDNQPPACRER